MFIQQRSINALALALSSRSRTNALGMTNTTLNPYYTADLMSVTHDHFNFSSKDVLTTDCTAVAPVLYNFSVSYVPVNEWFCNVTMHRRLYNKIYILPVYSNTQRHKKRVYHHLV